ncbi:hypothetical protein [Flammeovirga aprica]|uniref:Uncharacterized protein n=1 Tax=Flammeovirga aprica JL-4 TaxID=694437 RepID=A0A7X9RY17_9BACT|nr:hypothetical protein [Flammeovirga aprica]NME70747.1 hypothetical protein [Flammeovirga aprica JL-4]
MSKIKYIIIILIVTIIGSNRPEVKNDPLYNYILTFLSITIGFCITALTIIGSSKFSIKLYRLTSEKDRSKTLLHELTNNFKNTLYLFVSVVILIIIDALVSPMFFYKHTVSLELAFLSTSFEFSLKSLLFIFIIFLSTIGIVSFTKLLKEFVDFIIQTAKQTDL